MDKRLKIYLSIEYWTYLLSNMFKLYFFSNSFELLSTFDLKFFVLSGIRPFVILTICQSNFVSHPNRMLRMFYVASSMLHDSMLQWACCSIVACFKFHVACWMSQVAFCFSIHYQPWQKDSISEMWYNCAQ